MQCIDSESTFVASACECGVAVRNDSNTWHLPAKAQYFFSATNAGKKSKHGRDCRGLWKKIASLQFFPRSFLAKTALFFPKRNNAPSLALLIKAIPRKAPSKRKCRKIKIKTNYYLQDSKMMSARKITARAHVTTGISFAFLPAHFAIT